MFQLLRWLVAAGSAGAARNAGRVLHEQHQAERAVDALARRLADVPAVLDAAA